jgi:transposase
MSYSQHTIPSEFNYLVRINMGIVTMSLSELKIYRLGISVIEGKTTIAQFSIIINKSYRQSQRIIQKIRDSDVQGSYHGNKGRRPSNRTPDDLQAKILELLKTKYHGFNLTHFREYLESHENIIIKKDTLHRIAKRHGLVKNPHRRGRRCHKPRARLPQEGMMIQFDGSNHEWFGEFKTDLIGGIDDATGKVLAAEFFHGETSQNSMKVIREIIDQHGLPESFYMDQAGIYGKRDIESESQISRAFEQTNIRLILAGSSQAKGRIERLWRTFQDRLIAELKFYEVRDMIEANTYLKETFIPNYNLQFSVVPQDEEKAYRKNIFGNLDIIFCKKLPRKIGPGNTFSWQGETWVLEEKYSYANRIININTHLNNSNSFDIMGRKVHAKFKAAERRYDWDKKKKVG